MGMEKSTLLFIMLISSMLLVLFTPELYEFAHVFGALAIFMLFIFGFSQLKKIMVFALVAFVILPSIGNAAFTVTKNGATIAEPYSYFGDMEVTYELNSTITNPTNSITCTLLVVSDSSIAGLDRDYVASVKTYSGLVPGNVYRKERIKLTYLYEGQNELRMTCVPNSGTTNVSSTYVNKIDKWFIIFLLGNFLLTLIAVGMLHYNLFSKGDTMMYASIIAAFNLACLGATTSITIHSMAIKYIIGFLNFAVLIYSIQEVFKETQQRDSENSNIFIKRRRD
jgi:hypothetical protein